jgi:hypothetical protein
MAASLLQRNQLDYALRISGYHNECEVGGEWVAADATFAPGRCFLAFIQPGAGQVIVATSLPHVARAFTEEGHEPYQNVGLPPGAVGAFLIDVSDLHAAVRRIFELSRSLPSAPLDRFYETTRSLPASTEVERLIVQRRGLLLKKAWLLKANASAFMRSLRTARRNMSAGQGIFSNHFAATAAVKLIRGIKGSLVRLVRCPQMWVSC